MSMGIVPNFIVVRAQDSWCTTSFKFSKVRW
jgi:hypothetical protein